MTRKNKQHNKARSPKVTLHKLDWLEWITIVLGVWFWFYPHPYEILFAIVLSLPIIGLVLNGFSRPSLASLVSISHKKEDDDYDLADFIEFPGLVILIRVLVDYEFESFYSILKVGTVGFIILLLILAATHKLVDKNHPNKAIIYFSVIGNIALYSYAATYGINCVFDQSEPEIFQAKVINKSISEGRRHTTYYLRVTPWGHHRDAENISVTKSQYDETIIGETVSIDYQKGLLNIPWYFIEEIHPITSDKYNVNIKLSLPGNDTIGGLITITRNGATYKEFESKGVNPVALDFNENYLITCSKMGYASKTVFFDTHVPQGREEEKFNDFFVTVTLLPELEANNINSALPVGGVRYDTISEDFKKVE